MEMKELKDQIRAEAAFAIYALQEGRELETYEHLVAIDELCSDRVDVEIEDKRLFHEAAGEEED